MSVLHSCEEGFFISHAEFIDLCYCSVSDNSTEIKYKLKNKLFKIDIPYKCNGNLSKQRKRNFQENGDISLDKPQEEILHVEEFYKKIRNEIVNRLLFTTNQQTDQSKNTEAAEVAQDVYEQTGKNPVCDVSGGNGIQPIVTSISGTKYLFPSNCRFYCKDVCNINEYLTDEKYNFVVVDPPWWNKFVRRKKRKTEQGYKMMYSEDLVNIPIDSLLSNDGLIAVWCTNSQQHLNNLLNNIFIKWNVKFVAKLFWLKVTTSGEPVCPFAPPNGKQPFEQVVLACKDTCNYEKLNVLNGKIIVSVPSALHSHKPPLEGLLKSYLPENLNCLEIFARYLLPNWTSYGLEVLRFQHLSLYERVNETNCV